MLKLDKHISIGSRNISQFFLILIFLDFFFFSECHI